MASEHFELGKQLRSAVNEESVSTSKASIGAPVYTLHFLQRDHWPERTKITWRKHMVHQTFNDAKGWAQVCHHFLRKRSTELQRFCQRQNPSTVLRGGALTAEAFR